MIDIKKQLIKWTIFFAGLFVLSYGVVLTIIADLGVSPWDVFHLGIANVTNMSVGLVVVITGAVIVLIVCYYLRKAPQIGTVLNMLFIGIFIDLIMNSFLMFTVNTWAESVLVLILGTFLFGFGGGLYISSKAGAGPRDGLVLLLHVKKGWSIGLVRTLMELSALVIGLFLGGPVGLGTIFISFTIGPIMEFSINFWDKLFAKYV